MKIGGKNSERWPHRQSNKQKTKKGRKKEVNNMHGELSGLSCDVAGQIHPRFFGSFWQFP